MNLVHSPVSWDPTKYSQCLSTSNARPKTSSALSRRNGVSGQSANNCLTISNVEADLRFWLLATDNL
jgi:hypothetical protein